MPARNKSQADTTCRKRPGMMCDVMVSVDVRFENMHTIPGLVNGHEDCPSVASKVRQSGDQVAGCEGIQTGCGFIQKQQTWQQVKKFLVSVVMKQCTDPEDISLCYFTPRTSLPLSFLNYGFTGKTVSWRSGNLIIIERNPLPLTVQYFHGNDLLSFFNYSPFTIMSGPVRIHFD